MPASAPAPIVVSLGTGVRAVFTTRVGGRSAPPWDGLNLGSGVGDDPEAVRENRGLIAQIAGTSVVWATQVHGSQAVWISTPVPVDREHRTPPGDLLLTDRDDLALAVLAADCAPILAAGEAADGTLVRAAAHAGRLGVGLGVAHELVAQFARRGVVRPRVVIGPMICGSCYEVPAAMQRELARAWPEAACSTRTGTPSLDLRAALVAQLTAAGVREGDLTHVRRCTAEDPDLFSYRRDGQTGRLAAVITTRRARLPDAAAVLE